MYTGTTCCPFVCVEDVTGNMEEMNTVIFNPSLSKEHNKNIIARECDVRYGLILTDGQLDSLTEYDINGLNDFITELHNIIVEHRIKKSIK